MRKLFKKERSEEMGESSLKLNGSGDSVSKAVEVLVCTPVYRKGSYVIDKFLSNQKDIQREYPASALVLATVEHDFVDELERLLGEITPIAIARETA